MGLYTSLILKSRSILKKIQPIVVLFLLLTTIPSHRPSITDIPTKSRSILKKIQPILESPATLWLLTIMGLSDIVVFIASFEVLSLFKTIKLNGTYTSKSR